MSFVLVPTLETQQRLYEQPRDRIRFRAYLDELTGGGEELRLPLTNFNPVAREHAAEAVAHLVALGAETVAASAITEANDRLGAVTPAQAFRVGFVVSDDLGGMWTHRATIEFDATAAPGYRDWVVATFWTSERPTAEAIHAEVLAVAYRAAYLERHGAPADLDALLSQEALVHRFIGKEPASVDPQEQERITAILSPLRARGDRATVLTALFGDEAATELGYPALGLEAGAAVDLSVRDASEADAVDALVSRS